MKIRKSWGYVYAALAGLCDAGTGALLVFAPLLALRMMRIDAPPADLTHVRFVGAFVGAVGCSYLVPLLFTRGARRDLLLRGMLLTTTLIRLSVAAYSGYAVAAGLLETAWVSVPISDLAFAVIQIALLRQGVFASGYDA